MVSFASNLLCTRAGFALSTNETWADRTEAPREIVSSPPVIHPPLSTDEPRDKEEEERIAKGVEEATFRRRKNRVASSTNCGYRMAERRGLFSIASSYIRGGRQGKREVRVSLISNLAQRVVAPRNVIAWIR